MTEDAVWHRVDRELTRRRAKHLAPGSWYALGEMLGIKKQVVNNWRSRRVPPEAHEAIAAALEWSVDRLLGKADAAATAGLHASDSLGSYGLSIEDSDLLRDWRELLPEDRDAMRAQIAARAAQMREHARLVLERAGVKTISEPHPAEGLPPAPSPQPPPPSSGAAVQRGTILNRSGGVEHRSPALAKRKAR